VTAARLTRRAPHGQRLAQSALSAAVFASVAALLGGLAGFVYAHEPARDALTIVVEAAPPPESTTLGGTVQQADAGRIVVSTQSDPVELSFPPTVPLEQLEALAPAALVPGTRVNVGAERTATGTIVSGIVVLDAPR
jgi:hypothetical protein